MPSKRYFQAALLLGSSLLLNAQQYRISGPYAQDNLSIFLIHGAQKESGAKYLTLQEAMQQSKVRIYETGRVGELFAENLSGEDVFVESGDIVKGGWQDRVLKEDFVLPSKSGKVPIASFCVEHGRWTRRGGESAGSFGSSNDAIAGKSMKMAVRARQDQSEVWRQVAETRAMLASSLQTNPSALASPASPSSFQLTLENKRVAEAAERYMTKLGGIVGGKPDVIGYAFAINGKLNSADVYASHDLFQKLWPKLLKSSAVEAVADRSAPAARPADAAAVRALLAATSGRGRELAYETRDPRQGGWVHRSYLTQ